MPRKQVKQSRTGKSSAPKNLKPMKMKACPFCKKEITYIDYKDINLLRKYISDRGKIRDCDKGTIFHEFRADSIYDLDIFAELELEYHFPQEILKTKTIGTNLTFVVGNQPVQKLDFIERHYIYNTLVGNYTFDFPFFMPNSENNIEFIYNIPKLPKQALEDMANGRDIPARSDTFIFVNGKLVIHRRAKYLYKPNN